MNINDIVKIQREFDSKHGWNTNKEKKKIVELINKDLIGIMGELGEVANIIKKLNLEIDSENYFAFEEKYDKNLYNLSEEIVDMFIYLMRISSHLDIDLEKIYENIRI